MILVRSVLLFILTFPSWAYPKLQPLVDAVKSGDTLVLSEGIYAGPVKITIPLTIEGNHQVTIDGGGKGTVVTIETNGVQLRNLHLTNSGESYDQVDACVQVRGSFNIIKDNQLDNCLFGIDLQQAHHNVIRRNVFKHSKPFTLGLRGDAIRLWYSMGNRITHNQMSYFRDTVVWYSKDNLIEDNVATQGRYALHFMYSASNQVKGNHYEDNSVGIFLMYSDGVLIQDNHIARSTGATGVGIGFKETSNVTLEHNQIIYCASGIYLDLSPYQPDTTNRIIRNDIVYNGIGVLFHNDWQGNVFKENRFEGNYTQVAVQGAMTAHRHLWEGNYWDDYTGFDRNADGIGDTPYALYAYADQLWMDVPSAQFFRGSLVLTLLNFLEQLAPFSDPVLMLQDKAAKVR